MNLARVKEKFRHILHLDESPHELAKSFAVGVFIGFSPFIGLHTVAVLLFAWAFRLNKVAALTGAFLNNPWTIAFIYIGPTWLMVLAMRYVGIQIRPLNYELFRVHMTEVMDKYSAWDPMFWRMLYHYFKPYIRAFIIGTVIASVIASVLSYFLTYYTISYYRAKKAARHHTDLKGDA